MSRKQHIEILGVGLKRSRIFDDDHAENLGFFRYELLSETKIEKRYFL